MNARRPQVRVWRKEGANLSSLGRLWNTQLFWTSNAHSNIFLVTLFSHPLYPRTVLMWIIHACVFGFDCFVDWLLDLLLVFKLTQSSLKVKMCPQAEVDAGPSCWLLPALVLLSRLCLNSCRSPYWAIQTTVQSFIYLLIQSFNWTVSEFAAWTSKLENNLTFIVKYPYTGSLALNIFIQTAFDELKMLSPTSSAILSLQCVNRVQAFMPANDKDFQ